MNNTDRPSPTDFTAALPPRRTGAPANAALAARRKQAGVLPAQPAPPDVTLSTVEIGAISCAVCRPADSEGALIHLHGGGYRMGSAIGWTPFGARLAKACGRTVVLPDYSLAPEHPFPAAIHDALAVIGAMQATTAPGRLMISGDSAGGGLALAATLIAARAGVDVGGLVLISPWLDLTNAAPTFQTAAATDKLFSRQAADEAAEAYLQGVAATDPLASPLFGDLAQVPPTLVLVSTSEILLQDSLALAAKLALAGRPVQFVAVPGQPHVWPVLQPDSSATTEALEAIGAFVRRL